MTLHDLHIGDTATILQIHGSGAFRKRITEMGFVKGQNVSIVKAAPFKGPIECRIMSSTVSLRRAEAMMIDVSLSETNIEASAYTFQPIITESKGNANGWNSSKKRIKVALIGNPNCGKTTIYNRLSRSNERVANYSGVTVGSVETCFSYKGYDISFTDLPGTYSLSAYSEDEVIVRDFLSKENPDIVVNVIDATNPERHLYLTTQLIDMGMQVIIALNMYDELRDRGDKLDILNLGTLIGIPLVPTIGKKGKGVFRLMNRIISVYESREPVVRHIHINYGEEIEKSINKIESLLEGYEEHLEGQHLRYYAVRAIEKDDYCMHRLASFKGFEEIRPHIFDEINRLELLYKEDTETLISNARYAFIAGALRETYKKGKKDPALSKTQRIDKVMTHKYFGFLIFMLILFGMFHATFSIGQYPMDWIEAGVDWLGRSLSDLLPDGIFQDFLVDGIIGGVGGVIVFLPNILILFFIISLMEDTGYMARTAYIMDRVMHLFGLHGKSFIPMVMGFGCNVPAIMATRMLENKRDRLLTMMIIPFMSCSARLPVYILIAGAVFPQQAGNMIFLMYFIGIAFSILMALLLKSTIFKKSEAPFVMELPPYRAPGIRMVLKHMWYKGALYLKKMGGIILIASVVIWALGYFPRKVDYSRDYGKEIVAEQSRLENLQSSDNIASLELEKNISDMKMRMENERQENSYIGRLGKTVEPLLQPLGFDWKMGVALIAGFAAKEVVVSTMGVLYQVSNSDDNTVSLQEKLRNQVYLSGKRTGEPVYTKLSGFSFLLFVLLYLPCVSVIAVVGRESGSWKWSAFVVLYTSVLAWLTSFIVYQIGSLI